MLEILTIKSFEMQGSVKQQILTCIWMDLSFSKKIQYSSLKELLKTTLDSIKYVIFIKSFYVLQIQTCELWMTL
jgi:hypothetical protein